MTDTTALAITKPAPLVPYAEMSADRQLMLQQICDPKKNLSPAQFGLLCELGLRSGLDPFRKQIYGLIFDGSFQVVTGIDGFRAMARRNGLAGIDKPIFTYLEKHEKTKLFPLSCEITVYRWGPSGEREPYTASGLFREYARYKYNSDHLQANWESKPHLMLAKCVEALAHRMAFSEWFSGIHERAEFPYETGSSSSRRATQRVAPVSSRALIAGSPPGRAVIEAEVAPEQVYDPMSEFDGVVDYTNNDSCPSDKNAP